jgi:hypothetical protein
MTARPLRPPTGSSATFGLEAWLIGTPAELDAALAALASVGRVACHGIGRHGTREPLAGADYGRYRTYALTHLTGARTGPTVAPAVEASDD